MEDFPPVINIDNLLVDIYTHFDEEYPREACGVLGVRSGKVKFYPVKNVAKVNEDFVMNQQEYLTLLRRVDVVGIVHNHIYQNPVKASDLDRRACNSTGIPYYIFSYPGVEYTVIKPEGVNNSLLGRSYQFGTHDCFEAARDYYADIGIKLPERDDYKDDWWKQGLDYFTPEYIKSWGFKPVSNYEKSDLLIFKVNCTVANHCGVCIGNDVFYHHAQNRISCRENLYPTWIKWLTGIYRYET